MGSNGIVNVSAVYEMAFNGRVLRPVSSCKLVTFNSDTNLALKATDKQGPYIIYLNIAFSYFAGSCFFENRPRYQKVSRGRANT